MTKIIAFGHFKQSGKSTSCDFLSSVIRNRYNNNTDFYGNDIIKNLEHNMCAVQIYSFADKLKQFCHEVLGLTYDQVYGDDIAKSSLTHLRWEDMPGVISNEQLWIYLKRLKLSQPIDELLVYHNPGPMTAREVMQYFGTGICRKMYSNVWIDACLRQIKKDDCVYALIADCRFINEAQAVQAAGGKVFKFLRRPFPDDNHASEIDMINYEADAVIDNRDMTVDQKNDEVLKVLKEWSWM